MDFREFIVKERNIRQKHILSNKCKPSVKQTALKTMWKVKYTMNKS